MPGHPQSLARGPSSRRDGAERGEPADAVERRVCAARGWFRRCLGPMDNVRSVLPQAVRQLPWSPHRRLCEPDIDEVAIAADACVDVLATCEGDEVVVLAVSCHRGLLDGVVDDGRVSPVALDELKRSARWQGRVAGPSPAEGSREGPGNGAFFFAPVSGRWRVGATWAAFGPHTEGKCECIANRFAIQAC